MTLTDIKGIDKDFLTPAQVASVLGSDPQGIRVAARLDPKRLGFPVIRIGHWVKIPRMAFIRYMEGRSNDESDD